MSRRSRTLLIIDDDKLFCDTVSVCFSEAMFHTIAVHTGQEGIEWCKERKPDVILLDQNLPDIQGIELCCNLLSLHEQAKIIFITAYPSFDHAVKALRNGAHDYLSKPFELEELELSVRQAFRTAELELVEQVQHLKGNQDSRQNRLLGMEGGLAPLRDLIERASLNRAPVLITGETGTGKTVLAKTIHYLKGTKSAPFIDLNCAALPENLIEAELFGYEKGAFTDARERRKGLFELADGGTIFLDEIGELPLKLQSKLLGVLDNGSIRRLGGQMSHSCDSRIIAATNIELEQAVFQKLFREDLYYRMSVLRLHIPPLRQRKQDIKELVDYFMRSLCPDRNLSISKDEICRLEEYSWPGNVRELKNIIERAIILSSGRELRPSGLLVEHELNGWQQRLPDPSSKAPNNVESLAEVEKKHILETLDKYSGNRSHAAKALGIARSTLIRKLERHS